MRILSWLLGCVLLAAGLSGRDTQSLDFDWRFQLGDPAGAAHPAFDDGAWRRLDVPHDWSIEGEYKADNPTGPRGGYLPVGIGWYRRIIDVPPEWIGQRHVTVLFDGVFMNSTVWLNGTVVGARPYGYISFECDLTSQLRPGRNVLAVRVDASLAPASRWYTGAGIYGHVWLTAADHVRVAPWGTFVRTPTATTDRATVQVTTELARDLASGAGDQPIAARVRSTILDPSGAPVAETESELSLAPGAEREPVDQTLTVARPTLWSPETPARYTLVTSVSVGATVRDEVRTPFGIRSIRWDKDRGFLLNGRVVKLQGVNLHHDGGPVGAAIPDALNTRRLQQLKEMGVNAIRTAHNPRTPFFYAECDRLGLMVMDEIFDGWRKKAEHDYGGRFFAEWWKRDVTDWVRRDRNHPSVIIYSIGNETGQKDVHGITPLIHTLDATRPTTGGTVLDGVDVVGLNGPGEIPASLERFRSTRTDRPLVRTETPHTYQTRGFYRVLTWWRDRGKEREDYPPYGTTEVFTTDGDPRYQSSYDNAGVRNNARLNWKSTLERPWVAGEFRWVGFDYLGEAGTLADFPLRCRNQGVIDLAGFPKDHFYFYQSVWTERPMVHLLPHWTHPGLEGRIIPVVAYSNCAEVELFLNERSLGRQRRRDLLDFVWQVPYAPGELRAVGFRDGAPVAEHACRTAGPAVRLQLESDNRALATDRLDLSLVTFSVVDANGTLVPSANDRVDFRVTGPVRLLGYENGDPLDITPHRLGWRKAFAGLGRGFFASTGDDGPIEVIAAAILGERQFDQTATVAVDARRIQLRGGAGATAAGNDDFIYRFTTDGSEPSLTSARFEQPLTIDHDLTLRVLVLRGQTPCLSLAGEFRKTGPKRAWVDPRYEAAFAGAGAFPGPFDAELVGRWRNAAKDIELRADGVLLEHPRGKPAVAAGWWWYDFPNDVFEAARNDTGLGQLRWADGRTGRMQLVSRKADAFIVDDDANEANRYHRFSPGTK